VALTGSCAYGNPSFELCLGLTPTTIYLSTFAGLSRLRNLSFQFCPALTHAATYTFNLGPAPDLAAIYPFSGPRAFDNLFFLWP
jgi:hypothetical protein